jgi:ABC-type lipoprotein release transport system permease subunit
MPYNATISIDTGLTPSERTELMEALEAEPGIKSFMSCYSTGVSVRTDKGTSDNVSVRSCAGWGTPSEAGGHPVAEDYFCLYPRADGLRRYGKVGDLPRLAPTDDAIVIDEKLADNLGISEGDTVRLLDNDEKEYPVQVCG